MSWPEPVATDNSQTVDMTYPTIRPPIKLTVGLYKILYSAKDTSGNNANCSFVAQVASKCVVLRNISRNDWL